MSLKKIMLILSEKREKLTEKDIDFDNIRSILLRPLGEAIGDATVHSAHLSQLKSLFPDSIIGVVVTKQNRIIFERSNLVDKYVERNIFSYLKNYKKWDLLLDFENNFNSASLFMDRILMPKYIAIFRKKNKKHYNFDTIFNYNFYFPQKDNERLSHYLVNSLFNQDNKLPSPYSVLTTSVINDKKVENFWQKNKFRLLLCPQGSKREIPARELAELLLDAIPAQKLTYIDIILSYTKTAENYFKELVKNIYNIADQRISGSADQRISGSADQRISGSA